MPHSSISPWGSLISTRPEPLGMMLTSGFPATLEKNFRLRHLILCRARARVWQLLLVATGLIFAIARIHTGTSGIAASVLEFFLRFGVLIPVWTALAWLAWNRSYSQLYLPVARIAVPASASVLAVVMVMLMRDGRGEALSGLSTHALGILFLSGLVFREAVAACGLMVMTYSFAALYSGISIAKLGYDVVSPLLTIGIAVFVCREIEKASRLAFLDQGRALQQAASDSLTGLKNRRSFDDHFQRIWQHACRERHRMGLLLIDVDDFKRYNDRYGHQAGDQCLRDIAAALQRCSRRPLDLVARFGGEEFAAILYNVSMAEVVLIAESMRLAVEKLAIAHQDARARPVVTISIGAACVLPTEARTAGGLIQLADEGLYDAKSNGRNCVVTRDEEYQHLATGKFRLPMATAAPPGDGASETP